ncbi:hypothetical protein HU200_036965 [Digitaria exilis]|uniref:Uncharacterized protein n=1 Tax=Digitaria exilis TaxID=1010633 RepID=A0A835BFA1_9POAL|nr:hypothetical protein HU200_036965 [Digitaria exilis]
MVGSTRNTNDSKWESSDDLYFPLWIYENLDQYCLEVSEMAKGAGELVRKMIIVGLWCVQVMPSERPSMSQVVEMLESDLKDLQLPSQTMTCTSIGGHLCLITCINFETVLSIIASVNHVILVFV